jgi:putative FmdB family regulatory protein
MPATFAGSGAQAMPIYEYQCSVCGHRLEIIQRFTDAPLKDCPDCGESKLKKLVSAAGFRLGGKGWYETDFKNNKQRNLSQKDSIEDKKAAKPVESGDSKQSGPKKEDAALTKSSTASPSAASTT